MRRYIDGFVAAETRRDLKPVLKELFADENLVSRQMVDDLLKFKRLDGVRETLRGLADAMFKDGRQARSLVPDLQAAAIPLQIIWGARDAIIPATHARALPQASVGIIEEAGHMVMMEAAGRVNQTDQGPCRWLTPLRGAPARGALPPQGGTTAKRSPAGFAPRGSFSAIRSALFRRPFQPETNAGHCARLAKSRHSTLREGSARAVISSAPDASKLRPNAAKMHQ